MQSQPDPETRFDRGAWLTLAMSILLLLLPVVPTLIGINYPSDGWIVRTTSSAQNRFRTKITSQPSPLQPGDLLVAINGRAFELDRFPPLPSNLEVGQVLQYTVQRGDRTLNVEVTLVRRTISEVLSAAIQYIVNNPATTIPPALSFFIALPLFLLRPGNPAARYMLIIFSYYGPTAAIGFVDYHFYRWSYPAWLWFLYDLGGAGWALWYFPTWTLLALSLPVRKWPLTRFPRLLPALLYGWPFTFTVLSYVALANTGNLNSGLLNSFTFLPVTLAFLVALFGSLLHNFLTLRDPVARAQLRWLTLGLGLGWGVPIAVLTYTVIVGSLTPETDIIPLWLTVLLPICLAIAITRYRLFDIDLIIRRTLVYAVITTSLALTYLGLIIVLQNTFAAFTGQTQSPLVTVISTLAVAALFFPLRNRVQDFVDRRFYRKKYDAAKTLAGFAATARDEVELEKLTAQLVQVVEATMQPEHVRLWLKPTTASGKRSSGTGDK